MTTTDNDQLRDLRAKSRRASVDPSLRDEIPPCWTDEALGLPGSFCFPDGVRPWNWLELDRQEAEKLWSLLISFLAYFNRRYGERADRRIPPCWAEHGPLVEELTALVFGRWHAFESVHASVDGAQYRHSYTLPAFYERMASWLGDELLACQQGRHRDRDDLPLKTDHAWSVRTEILSILDSERRREPPDVTRANRRPADSAGRIEIPFLGKPDQMTPIGIHPGSTL